MGIWTAVVCASALAAAQGTQQAKAEKAPAQAAAPDAERPDAFDFEGPNAQVTLSTPAGVAVRGDKSKKIRAELSVQAQDRVGDKGHTYGDSASVIARFKLDGKDLEVTLRESGFGPNVSNDATRKLQPDGVEGGVALSSSGDQPGAPASLKVWGVAEVRANGKTLTDAAVLSLEARERTSNERVTLKLEGLPAELAPGGRMDLRFNDAVVTVEEARDRELQFPEPAVAIELTPEADTGVGGAGAEGAAEAEEEEQPAEAPPAQGAAPPTGGAAQPGGPGAAQAGTTDAAASPQGIAYPTTGNLGSTSGIAYDSTGLPPSVGGSFTGVGVGGAGTAGDQPDAVRGTAGQGTSTGPGASSGATQGGAALPLSGIDYSGAAGAGPALPSNTGTDSGGTFGFGDLGPIDYSPQVGSPGVPAAAAASPGSPSDLGQRNGAQVSPGIPASPPVLNNGRFPEALEGGSGFTPGIPATPGVLNDGTFPQGSTTPTPTPTPAAGGGTGR